MEDTPSTKQDIPQGTLDLMILQSLAVMGPQHGFGLARRIEQVSEDSLTLQQGTIYPALVRLEKRGWIESEWGVSENKRKARFYSITRAGRKQLVVETAEWRRLAGTMARLLQEPERLQYRDP